MTALPESEAATSRVLNALPSKTLADGVGDGRAVDDGAIDDAVGRHRLDAEAHDLVALAAGLEFDGFDGARPDVEADERPRSYQTLDTSWRGVGGGLAAGAAVPRSSGWRGQCHDVQGLPSARTMHMQGWCHGGPPRPDCAEVGARRLGACAARADFSTILSVEATQLVRSVDGPRWSQASRAGACRRGGADCRRAATCLVKMAGAQCAYGRAALTNGGESRYPFGLPSFVGRPREAPCER